MPRPAPVSRGELGRLWTSPDCGRCRPSLVFSIIGDDRGSCSRDDRADPASMAPFRRDPTRGDGAAACPWEAVLCSRLAGFGMSSSTSPGISLTTTGLAKKFSKLIRSTGLLLSKPLTRDFISGVMVTSLGNLMTSSAASIFLSSSTWFLARNGGFPEIISYRTVPTDHRSALASYRS